MILEIKDINMIEAIKMACKENDVEINIFNSAYKALASIEAQSALDTVIQEEDLFISKEDYTESLELITKDVYDMDEDIMIDYSYLAADLCKDVLRRKDILVD